MPTLLVVAFETEPGTLLNPKKPYIELFLAIVSHLYASSLVLPAPTVITLLSFKISSFQVNHLIWRLPYDCPRLMPNEYLMPLILLHILFCQLEAKMT